MRYKLSMKIILKTDEFDTWFRKLRDRKAKIYIGRRIERAESDNFGDHKSVGDGVSEMRITYGPGYRVYYAHTDGVVYILLIGGDKSTQSKDIITAKRLWQNICLGDKND